MFLDFRALREQFWCTVRFAGLIFLAILLAGCSRPSVQVSVTNHSGQEISLIYVCNDRSCQRIGSLAPGATIRVKEPLAGKSLSVTYWVHGQHEREFKITDDAIRSGFASLTIGTNYLAAL